MTYIKASLEWLQSIIDTAIRIYFGQECPLHSIYEHPAPATKAWDTFFQHPVTFDEKVILLLGLAPHLSPQLLDIFFVHNKNFDRPYTEFGGWKGTTHNGFLPTGETVAFLLAGEDIGKKAALIGYFSHEHWFYKENILRLEGQGEGEPFLSGQLRVSEELLSRLFYGQEYKPDYTLNFPAKRITTLLEWEDLVLDYQVTAGLEEINTWIRHEQTILEDPTLKRFLKPGYRALFYGPPGTGKTLAATLIGKRNGMDVYRIDLSMIVSKYIGETEKNLARIFDLAENRNWILFFDEADSLFGKRSSVNNSNDRHANQEIAFLLQRIEDFRGIILLATNLRGNIDEAFSRRFQSVIYFPIPEEDLRKTLWNNMLPTHWFAGDKEEEQIANKRELIQSVAGQKLTGGTITNIVRRCAIQMLANKKSRLDSQLLKSAIRKELYQEGRIE